MDLWEKTLYDAATQGDVHKFPELLEKDPLILDRAILNSPHKTPLHAAAFLGHVNFVKEVMKVNSYMCFLRDKAGRNPLHLAAMSGKLEVLKAIIDSTPQAVREKTDDGETILHLCAKYGQLKALKMVVHAIDDPDLLNAKNDDGMTILHMAIVYKQTETIKYLLDEARVGVNIENANGKTALDLLSAQGNIRSDIRSSLQKSKALRGKDVHPLNGEPTFRALMAKNRKTIMVVASLIATMAFQVVLNPPGGVWQDDSSEGPNPHKIGEVVMAKTHPALCRLLIRATSTAFVSSLTTVMLLMDESRFIRRSTLSLAVLFLIMTVAIMSILLTYAISLVTVAPKDIRGRLSETGVIVLIVVMAWSISIPYEFYEFWYMIKNWRTIMSAIRERTTEWEFYLRFLYNQQPRGHEVDARPAA
nr:ankyrin repeat-containing protein BDA1-like [Coffea arabica]